MANPVRVKLVMVEVIQTFVTIQVSSAKISTYSEKGAGDQRIIIDRRNLDKTRSQTNKSDTQ